MDEVRLHLVRARAQSAVEGDAVEPVAQVGLGDAPVEHTLKVYGEVEGHVVEEVRVDEYNGLRPFCFLHKSGVLYIWVVICRITQMRIMGLVFVVEVEIVAEEERRFFGELVKGAAVLLCGAARASRAVHKTAYAAHFEQFVLVGGGDVFKHVG